MRREELRSRIKQEITRSEDPADISLFSAMLKVLEWETCEFGEFGPDEPELKYGGSNGRQREDSPA